MKLTVFTIENEMTGKVGLKHEQLVKEGDQIRYMIFDNPRSIRPSQMVKGTVRNNGDVNEKVGQELERIGLELSNPERQAALEIRRRGKDRNWKTQLYLRLRRGENMFWNIEI